ncbi:hypothetical protein Taro_007139 [Colocasia esculenta]|uniref:Uncharacterized protein n=1 Tax=Colocasia esculenta TaxID=4460 RepID=A0A843TQL3_COLES|nr:hypothetical protein [Colocasia esculenta]
MQNWSSSVDTRSSSVDTRDPSQNTFWANLGQCVDTRSGSFDTRDLPRTPSGLGYKSCKVWFRFDPPLVDFTATVCAGRNRLNGEEDEFLVVVRQLLSHQELPHTTPASSKTHP